MPHATPAPRRAELDQQHAAITGAIQSVFNRADAERRPVTATEHQQIEALEATLATIDGTSVGRRARPSDNMTVAGGGSQYTATAGRTCREMFGPADDDGEFKNLTAFARAVATNSGDIVRYMATGNSSITGSDGGYLIPTGLSYHLLDSSLESELIRPRARALGMETSSVQAPYFKDYDHSSSTTFGGLKGTWTGEGQNATYRTFQLSSIALNASKCTLLVAATNELLADAPGFGPILEDKMRQSVGWNLDDAFLNGTGVGQPLGILNSPCLITQTKEAGQLAATLEFENFVNMLGRLPQTSVPNAVWLVSQTCIPQLMTMFIGGGVFGGTVPVLQGRDGNFSILNRPVVVSEKLPTLGTVGDIILADLSHYVVGILKGGMRLDVSGHSLFRSDETAIRLVLRADGQPRWSSVFTPKNGSTLSPFVVLETRS